MKFKISLFLVLLICSVGLSSAVTYNSGTDIATIGTESVTLLEVLNAVNNTNKFSIQGSSNYTMNISSIVIGGTLTLDNDILNFKTDVDNGCNITINGGKHLIIKNGSLITSINKSARGSFYSAGCPTTFNISDSTLSYFYEVDFNNYGSNEDLAIINSTLSHYYEIYAFEGVHMTNCDISYVDNIVNRQSGDLIGNNIHDCNGIMITQYMDANDCILIANNTFERLVECNPIVFLKERQNYIEVVNNSFTDISSVLGGYSACIDVYNNNHDYTDSNPMWIHNNTFTNISSALYMYKRPYFIFENNTVEDSANAFLITISSTSNGTSYFRNNVINNCTNGIHIKNYPLYNVKFVNNSYHNVGKIYYFKDQNLEHLTFENESYSGTSSMYFDAATAMLTNCNYPIKFTAPYSTGGTLKQFKNSITLKTNFYITILRNSLSTTQQNVTWTDVKTYEVTDQSPTYTIENLYLNRDYKVYKDDALQTTLDSGASGSITFQSHLNYTPGNRYTVMTILDITSYRYNSVTPIFMTIRSDNTFTFSRNVDENNDMTSNLKVVFT